MCAFRAWVDKSQDVSTDETELQTSPGDDSSHTGTGRVSCCILVCTISNAVHALKASPKRNTNATKIGMPLHLKWKQMLLWRSSPN